MTKSLRPRPIRFGVFEVDFEAGELRKRGVKIRLHEQPFKVLCVLLERPGEVVTREDLCKRLWSADTFTDSDLGLNSAVMRLRVALGDDAENPRFIETLPRRGYRLIVPIVEIPEANGLLNGDAGAVLVLQETVAPPPPSNPPRKKWWWQSALATVVVSIVAFGAWRLHSPVAVPYTIAVMPFANLSPGAGSDYFSDGLTDEIISNLSVIDGLEVKSQTSSFSFKNKPNDIHTVGKQLGVDLVLEGSVLRDDGKLRVTAQLVRVADDHPIWAGHFDRQLTDIFAVQDEISRSVVSELRLKLGRGQRRYNTDIDTYDLYLKARALSNQTPGADSKSIALSIPVFEAALARDSNFAPAYAGIAGAYADLSSTSRNLSPEVAFPKIQEACERARFLDPLLAEAFSCMGLVHARQFSWKQAEDDFRQAIRLNSNLVRPHEDLAMWILFPMGRLKEAEEQLRISMKLDPLNPRVVNGLDMVLMSERRFDETIDNCRKNLASNTGDYAARQIMARALIQKGDYIQGTPLLEQMGRGSEAFLGYAYAKQGRGDDARRMVATYPNFPWVRALVSGGLGDKDQAVMGLEGMATVKDPRFGFYAYFPELSLVRGDQHLNDLRATEGLPGIK